jgi:hypothetical protein
MKTCLTALFAALVLYAFQAMPRCTSVEPDTGKVGDLISAKGESLDKKNLAELYLSDGGKDIKAVIAEQSETEIKFKVPQIKAGRYHLITLTGNRASMIEQPVVLTVE